MNTTTRPAHPSSGPPSSVAERSGPVVELDPMRVLQATADCVFAQARAEADLLEAAVRWADLNPVTDQAPCAADWWDGEDVPVPGRIPEVAAPAVAEFAAAAGRSSGAGKWVMFEALQLRHRMPRTWVLVRQCRMPAFRARQLVMACYRLNDEAVAWLDGQTAAVCGRIGPVQLDRMVVRAAALFDPDWVADQKRKRYVRVDHRDRDSGLDGSTVHGCLDPLDAVDLDAALDAGAEARRAWGSTADRDGRRAQALGDLARARLGETPLPFEDDDHPDTDPSSTNPGSERPVSNGPGSDSPGSSGPDSDGPDSDSPGSDSPGSDGPDGDSPAGGDATGDRSHDNRSGDASRGRPLVPPLVSRPRELTLYIHLSDLALRAGTADPADTAAHDGGEDDQVWLGEFGSINQPVTAELVRTWCGNPNTTVIVKPVIDLRTPIVSQGYRPTPRQRQHLALTDPTCAFPHCTRPLHPVPVRRQTDNTLDNSWDADHTTAWHEGDDTSTNGMAGLCRQHHRGKTLHGWRYRRLTAGLVLWRSRHGMEYLRTPTGTTELGHHTSGRDRTVPGWLDHPSPRPPELEPPPDPADHDHQRADPPPDRPPDRDGGQDQLLPDTS